MGSFSMACAVSGLPLSGGDRIRYLLVTANPYTDQRPDEGHWILRTFPLRTEYNDYGGVREIPNDLSTRAWIECLKLDMIEVGVGNNSCHDVAVSPNSTFEQIREALWEGRLNVRAYSYWESVHGPSEPQSADSDTAWPLDAVMPRLQNIRAILQAEGFKVNTPADYTGESFLVDEVEHGMVRIRVGGFSMDNADKLAPLLPHLTAFAAMITCGSGNYAGDAEIIVLPKPGKDPESKHRITRHPQDASLPLALAQCMIREDVWQALLKMKLHDDWLAFPPTLASLRRDAIRMFTEQAGLCAQDYQWAISDNRNGSLGAILSKHLKAMSPGHHWQWALNSVRGGERYPDAEVLQFVNDVAETAYVSMVLTTLRKTWQPTYSIGSQEPDNKPHKAFFAALSKLSRRAPKVGRKQPLKAKLTFKPIPPDLSLDELRQRMHDRALKP